MTTGSEDEQRDSGPGEPDRVPPSAFTNNIMAQSNPPAPTLAIPQTPPCAATQQATLAAAAHAPGRPSPSILRGADQLLAIIEEEKAKAVTQLRTTHEADKLWWSQTIAHLQQQARQTASQLEAQRDHALALAATSERLASEAQATLKVEGRRADAEKARADAAEARLATLGLL